MRTIINIFCITLFLPALSNAQNLGVRAQSLGGAIRAQASSNDVIFYNPAGMLKHRRLAPEVDYLHGTSSGEHRMGASLVDSQTGAWALGLAYSGLFQNEKKASHLAYLSIAMPIVSDMLALGLSASYCYNEAVGPVPYAHFFNVDAGFLANLPYGMAFALTANRLLKPKGNEKSLGLALGSAFDLGQIVEQAPLSLSFDWLMDDVTSDHDLDHIFGAGMQYLMLKVVPLRVGFKAAAKNSDKLLSLGSGILSELFAFDGLYSQDLSVGKNRYFGAAFRFSL